MADEEVVKILTSLGLDHLIKSFKEDRIASGLTPLHLAMGRIDTNGDIAMFNFLIKYKAEDPRDRSAVIILLIEAGADVILRDSLGMTPLHYATLPTLYPHIEQLHPLPKIIADDPILILLSLGEYAQVNKPAYNGQLL